MQVLWCWRCQQDMPMLDEDEFVIVSDLYAECFRTSPRSGESKSMDARFEQVRTAYERLTGLRIVTTTR
jgi:hypothetical protein